MPKKEVEPSQKDKLKHNANTKDSVSHLVIAPKSSPITHTSNSSAHALSPSLHNIFMSPSTPHTLRTQQLIIIFGNWRFFIILRLFKNVVFKQRTRKTQNICNVT